MALLSGLCQSLVEDSWCKLLHRYYTRVYQSREWLSGMAKGSWFPLPTSACYPTVLQAFWLPYGFLWSKAPAWVSEAGFVCTQTSPTQLPHSAIPKSLLERKHKKSFWLRVYPIIQHYICSTAVQLLQRLILLSILKVCVIIC